ncbi:hypothetical protein PN462_07100 [Spirulina sp. CS-785/01]|uniref:T4SS efffector SepA family protein n=1 Tax=Spirulina sp. CS-785/01 TaxID=3021716 RepID=UPI00232B918F|nr:hypothetical protein [Spirulina sp. CS-785/01]MDB9312862.1 hypothetical protein [Spirulina sp. CS-785/01]
MSQVIRVSDITYQRLEKHAKGFDSPGNVIERLLDFYDKNSPKPVTFPEPVPPPTIQTINSNPINLNPDTVNLTYTKILQGHFGDSTVKSYKDLVYQAHRYALDEFTVDEIIAFSKSNIVKGKRNDSGFFFYSNLGISIQRNDANKSWQSALYFARELKKEIEVLVEWRNHEKAAYPGKVGKLCISEETRFL